MLDGTGRWREGQDALRLVTEHWRSHFDGIAAARTQEEEFCSTYADEIQAMADKIDAQFAVLPPDIQQTLRFGAFATPNLAEFKRSIKKMKGTAPGIDGWSADELGLLPDEALRELLQLCVAAEKQGTWAAAMFTLRQVHIPKGEDQIYSKLRPIAIASVVVRAWQRLRAHQIMQFTLVAFPECQAGGLAGRALEPLMDPVLEKMEHALAAQELFEQLDDVPEGPEKEEMKNFIRASWDTVYLTSWDFKAAFDTVAPSLVGTIWRRLGVPERVVGSIMALWQNQKRYIEINGMVSEEAVFVRKSMPQGCPAAMLGMATVLAPVILRVAREAPGTVLAVFADDRTMVAPTEGQKQAVQGVWDELHRLTAMRANDSKQQDLLIEVRRPADRRHLPRIQGLNKTEDGAPCRILGFEVGSPEHLTPKEESRIEEARGQLRRVASTPCGISGRRAVIAGLTITQLTWAGVLRGYSQQTIQGLQVRVRSAFKSKRWSSAASGPFDILVCQHRTAVDLQLLTRVWKMVRIRVKRTGLHAVAGLIRLRQTHHLRCAGVTGAFLHYMQMLGWRQRGGTNTFENMYDADAYVKLDMNSKAAEHQLRAAWRAKQWANYIGGKRREVQQAQQRPVKYQHELGLLGMQVIDRGSVGTGDYISILTGDYWSDARRFKTRKQSGPVPLCVRCRLADATADHDFWECPAFSHWRCGVAIPACTITRRAAWTGGREPVGREGLKIFAVRADFMASVRMHTRECAHARAAGGSAVAVPEIKPLHTMQYVLDKRNKGNARGQKRARSGQTLPPLEEDEAQRAPQLGGPRMPGRSGVAEGEERIPQEDDEDHGKGDEGGKYEEYEEEREERRQRARSSWAPATGGRGSKERSEEENHLRRAKEGVAEEEEVVEEEEEHPACRNQNHSTWPLAGPRAPGGGPGGGEEDDRLSAWTDTGYYHQVVATLGSP